MPSTKTKMFFGYKIIRCPDFFYDANPHYVASWYKCFCRLSGVRLDKWMRKSSAMNFGLQSDQTCGGQTNTADWYLSCPTTECWERTDCFTVGKPARGQIPKPDILCQRSWFPSFHYQETERLLSLDQSVKTHKIRHSTKSKYIWYTMYLLEKKKTLRKKSRMRYNNINSQLDATITNFIYNYNQFNMFRAIISPILRSTRLCLQLVI